MGKNLLRFHDPNLWLGAYLLVFTVVLIAGAVSVPTYLAVTCVSLAYYLLVLGGPDSVSEFRAGHISIKRDVRAAKKILKDIERISTELKLITRLSVENSYILANTSFMAMGGEQEAQQRLEGNLEKLTLLLQKNESEEKRMWGELEALFAHRKSNNDN